MSVNKDSHHHHHLPSPITAPNATLGRHLARRFVEISATDVFSVPGDFNVTLLDQLITEPNLNNIGCCNELNAGYAADGYARSRGAGARVVTFTVGGLSVINAIAGAYSEDIPVILWVVPIPMIMGLGIFCTTRLDYRISVKSYDAFKMSRAIK
ncbi:unnamed protein product [Camellia sinensis]